MMIGGLVYLARLNNLQRRNAEFFDKMEYF